MPRFIGDNGLSLALLSLFLLALAGQAVTGWKSYNQEQQHHNQPQAGFGEYLTEGHFIEAVFENWESEFLQDAVYVLFTAFLFQRGSAESKDPDKDESGRQRSTRVIERSQCALAGSARRRLAEPLQTLAADHLSAALSFFIRHARDWRR